LQAAQKLTSVYKAYTNSADQSIQLLTALQTSLAKDVICAFPRIDRVDHIQRVLEVICTFASWTNPRDLLLGRNIVTGGGQTYKRELAVMAEMYECAPTQREENAQVAGSMLEHAGECASSAWDVTRQIARAFQGAPAAPAPPEQEWAEVLFEFGLKAATVWFWMFVVKHVCAAWIEGLYMTLPLPEREATAAFKARPPCNWDAPALVCVSVLTVWRGSQSTGMLFLTVRLLSLQLATAWPWIAYLMGGNFAQINLC